jgi:hypothetical protein
MTRVPVVNPPETAALDGFGRRTRGIDSDTGDEVELLDLTPELVDHSGFVTALAERVARFATVRHASYAHLRRLDRPASDRLELVSELTPGWRLSDLLTESNAAGVAVDITVVIGVLRQLLPAVALYGRHNRDAAIGALAPERLIVTPQARVVIAEHAFGPALEKLNLGRDRLWRELRVAMPPSAGLPRSNQRADANALGVVALSLVLGRVLETQEYPGGIQPLVEGAVEYRNGQPAPLSPSFAGWLSRALQFDVRTAFQSPSEAQLAFETVLASDRSYVTSPAKFEEWVARVGGAIDVKRRPPEPEPPPPPPEPEPEPEPVAAIAPPIEIVEPVPEPVSAPAESSELRSAEPIVEAIEQPITEPIEEQAAEPIAQPVDEPSPSVVAAAAAVDGPETLQAPEAPRAAKAPKVPLMAMAAVIVLLLAAVGWLMTRDTGAPRAGEGELVVESRPPGARVVVDGKDSGVTPVTLRLPAGAHVLEVQAGKSEPRVIPLMIRAGVQTAQYIELQQPPLLPAPPPAEKTRKR